MSENSGEVRVARTDGEREAAFDVRWAVFVAEQGVAPELERDEYDDDSAVVHLLAGEGDRAVGAARVRPVGDGVAKLERVAVRESARGDGWGRRLVERAESEAATREWFVMKLHAQSAVERFYDALGYETVGDEFEEAGIPHVEMEKRLDGAE